jgi:hypothetical protein
MLPSITDTPKAQVIDEKGFATGEIMQGARIIFNEKDSLIEAGNAVLKP